MSVVYAFAALENESQAVRNITGPNDVVLITSGMGPLNAKSKADVTLGVKSGAFAAREPDAVLIIGLCGGLAEYLPERRIVAYTGCLSTETTSPMLPCAEIITDSMVRLLACSDIPCDRVVGITSPRMATTPDERIALARSGAAAVDMESYSIFGRGRNGRRARGRASRRVGPFRPGIAGFQSRLECCRGSGPPQGAESGSGIAVEHRKTARCKQASDART